MQRAKVTETLTLDISKGMNAWLIFSILGYESDACRKLDSHILSEHIQQWGFWQIPNAVHLLKESSAVLMETESIGKPGNLGMCKPGGQWGAPLPKQGHPGRPRQQIAGPQPSAPSPAVGGKLKSGFAPNEWNPGGSGSHDEQGLGVVGCQQDAFVSEQVCPLVGVATPEAGELLSNKHPFTRKNKKSPIFAQQLEEETEEPLGSRILVGYDNAHEEKAAQGGPIEGWME
ncbi:hypothetical protein NQZ68_020398 [Dissostichus eleginoides]|nr:hypothetical protein NQZ68_020398 [Dissostichus eleginoides]